MKYIICYRILTFTLPLLHRKENMVSTVFLKQESCIFLLRASDDGLKGCITRQDSEGRLQQEVLYICSLAVNGYLKLNVLDSYAMGTGAGMFSRSIP
jgi:hypothetical protein